MKRYEQADDGNGKRLTIVQVAPDYYPVPPPAYGGIERMVHTLTEQLVHLGHKVYLFASEGSVTSAVHIPYTHAPGNPEAIVETVLRHLPEDADLIHDHTHGSVIGRLDLPLPVVCTLHASVNNGVAHPVYGSRTSAVAAGADPEAFIHLGLHPDDYDFAEDKKDYLLFMGVISPHKGIHHALTISERTGRRLILAGPVFSTDYYRSEIEPVLLRNPNIEYAGEVGGEEKRRLLREAACLLFPTCCEEAFGLVMVEAMMSGTPVLGLANGAVPEVLSGLPELVCQSVEEMVEKLETAKFPTAGELRNYVLGRYSREGMALRYESMYHLLLEKSWVSPKGLSKWKELGSEDLALKWCDAILSAKGRSTLGDKLFACNEAAEIYRLRGERELEKTYVYRSFEFAPPRAEFCCRLGYSFLQVADYEQAAFWYGLATRLTVPTIREREGFYLEDCWTWLPHIQLCVCHYHLGNLDAAFSHNEQARQFRPTDPDVLHNRSFLEGLLHPDVSRTNPGRLAVTELRGAKGSTFRMNLQLPGLIEETIHERGAWEPELIRFLEQYVRPDSIFVDVGANIGYHTLYMASHGDDVRCVAFEPHPENYRSLVENTALNDFDHVEAYDFAIGEKTGEMDFYFHSHKAYNRGLSGTRLSGGAQQNEFIRGLVSVKPLDGTLNAEDLGKVSVLKIDTQGYEFEVLSGAKKLIQTSRPVIAFEHHPYGTHSLEEILKLLPGYTVHKLQVWSGELRKCDEPDPEGFEGDYVCIPA